jgi:pimeloyl-ACP methyl ester carboxylesterase
VPSCLDVRTLECPTPCGLPSLHRLAEVDIVNGRDFCVALEIEKPVVMGTSFGGHVAMAYTTRHPDHPGKLILCTTSPKWRLERVLDAFERIDL